MLQWIETLSRDAVETFHRIVGEQAVGAKPKPDGKSAAGVNFQPFVALLLMSGMARSAIGELLVSMANGSIQPSTAARAPVKRVPPGTNSATASTFSLVKNIVGAGMLALPAGMAAGEGTGFGPAAASVVFICILSAYTFSLTGRAVEATGAADYRDLWSRSLGAGSSWLIDAMILGVAAGALLIYNCFLGDLLSTVTNGSLSRTKAILIMSGALLPLCQMPDLSALAPASLIGVGAVIYTAIFVVMRFFDGSCAVGGKFAASLPQHLAEGTDVLSQASSTRLSLGTCILFNMLLTAYMAHTNAVRFYNELEDRSPEKFDGVVSTAFAFSALIYLAVMLAGYATFGSSAQPLILNNYAFSDKAAHIARIATGLSIMGSYPLLFTSLRDVTVSTLKSSQATKKLGAALGTVSSLPWRLMSLVMLCGLTATALVTTNVGFVVSLSGSLFGASIIFCVPALIYMSVTKQNPRHVPALGETAACHFVFIFGLLAAIFGTVVTLLESFNML